jgi:hypothetical protein
LSQADARGVAWLTKGKMQQAFRRGEDVHVLTATLMDITRDLAKRCNHALNYGMGPNMLSIQLGITVKHAKELIKKYHTVYPEVHEWHAKIREQLKENRTLVTPLGRRRTFLGNWDDKLFRTAYAFIPQSHTSDVLNIGLVELWLRLADQGINAYPILQVHDEIVVECPLGMEERVLDLMLECLERPVVIEGEVSQLAKLEERRLITEEEYLRVINAKTAVLFGAACEVGAIIANQSPNYCNAMRNFGMKLGEIFQITDDLLDYFTQGEVRGKNIGDDFAEGKVTLPLIFLSRKLPKNKKERLMELITAHERTSKDFHWVTDLLISFDIKNEILEYLEGFKISAYKCLEEINIQNETRGYLKSLVNFAVERSY